MKVVVEKIDDLYKILEEYHKQDPENIPEIDVMTE